MLRITQRTCRLGEKYAGKKVEDDGAELSTFKVELHNVVLSAEELNSFLGYQHAFDKLFDVDADGVAAPWLHHIEPITSTEKLEGAHVVLLYDFGKSKIELKRATLTKLRVHLRHGGEAWLSCAVEGEPVLNYKLVDIVSRMGEAIECEIRADRPSDQQSLPINAHGPGEAVPVTHKPPKDAH